MTEKEALLLLSQDGSFTPSLISKLRSSSLLTKLNRISLQDLLEIGVEQKTAKKVLACSRLDLQKISAKLKKNSISFITIKDRLYPDLLREINDPPQLLYYLGDIALLKKNCIAFVGSRKATSYGAQAVKKIIGELSGSPVVIVSGLALGIDSVSHREALLQNMRTVAVLGNGLPAVYPVCHQSLAKKILKNHGLIISEFPLRYSAYPSNFPRRNRIIAGLCKVTVIVQAALRSGTLITARLALDYNRDVFAVPQSIFDASGAGSNLLIRQGAGTLTDGKQLLDALGLDASKNVKQGRKEFFLSPNSAKIISALTKQEQDIDQLASSTKLNAGDLAKELTFLEMEGFVANNGKGGYRVLNKQ